MMKRTAALIIIFPLFGFAEKSPKNDSFEKWPNRPKAQFIGAKENFEKVRQMIFKEYAGKDISEEELYMAATKGMLNALNRGDNKWNKLMSPAEYREVKTNLKGKISGIGAGVRFVPELGIGRVVNVFKKSPAEKAGLEKGDQILSVNGRLYKGLTLRDMIYDIRGPIGEKVSLKILRGDKIIEKDIVRGVINWSAVESSVDNGIGKVKIHHFARSTPALLKEHLEKLKSKDVKGLVLDLRKNNGGIFEMAIHSADHLLPKGKTITWVHDRRGQRKRLVSRHKPVLKVPTVILVDKTTSSGAELMAASLKDNLNTRLIGQKTFGKWNTQIIRRLPNKFAVQYTVQEFRSPRDLSFQDVGLTPDVLVTNSPDQVIKGGPPKLNPNQDPQMRTAIHLLQMMI